MTVEDDIDSLQDAVLDIQNELGTNPSTVYSNVRARLDILEKRMVNQLDPSPNAENPFIIGSSAITVRTGPLDPITLAIGDITGSLYLSEDGYGLYYRRDGYWDTVNMEEWIGAGDLAGDYSSQTVVGLQGNGISTNAPLDGYRLTWNDTDGYWEPQIGFTALGDLSGTVISQTVIGIRDRSITSNVPIDNDIYIWDNSGDEWVLEQLAVIFDPLHTGSATNIRTNRLSNQSPIDNTKVGIVNLGSDSDQTSTGVTGDYSSILGGDLNEVTSDYSTVIDGYYNRISLGADYSAILSGDSNLLNASAAYSSIVTGLKNTLNGTYSIIGDGYQNSASGTYNIVLNGNTCILNTSNYSTILSGLNNTITSGSDYSALLSGHDNTLTGNYSGILFGDNINVLSDSSVVLFGTTVTVNSDYSIVLNGQNSTITGEHSLLSGINNTINTATDGYSTILNGHDNSVNTDYSFAIGRSNSILTDSDFSTILGDNNTVDVTDTLSTGYSFVNGLDNTVNGSHSVVFGNNNAVTEAYSLAIGNTNNIDGYYSSSVGYTNTINDNFGVIFGRNNQTDLEHGFVIGNEGRAKFNYQKVHSARALDGLSTLGASQQSNIILDGSQTSGGSFYLQLPNTSNHLTLDNNKVYDITLRALVVTTSGTYACARFVYNMLVHVEGGSIVLDNVTQTYVHDSGAPANGWTITVSNTTNELEILVDSSGVEDRRAIATIEWRELLRT